MVVTCGEAVALFAAVSYGHDWNPVLTYVLHPPSPPTKYQHQSLLSLHQGQSNYYKVIQALSSFIIIQISGKQIFVVITKVNNTSWEKPSAKSIDKLHSNKLHNDHLVFHAKF